MQAVRDDTATVEYHRGPPLPLRPTLLAPHPANLQPAQDRPPSPRPLPRPGPAVPPSRLHPPGPRPDLPSEHPRPTPRPELGASPLHALPPSDLARSAQRPLHALPPTDLARSASRPGLPPPGPVLIAPRPGSPPTWGQPAPCTTCPFRQLPDRTLIIPDAGSQPDPTATQLLPGSSGSTTVLQLAEPPPPRRRHVPPPPPRRSPLVYVQLGLWLVIAVGLLILALRQVS